MGRPEDRPVVTTDHHTEDLPATPQRDRTIPAERWVEAPPELLELGSDIGAPLVAYKRRIGRWLLWRAGPARKADARYMALAADDLSRRYSFRLFPDGTGEGEGPDGRVHHRFRAWKEALRDAGASLPSMNHDRARELIERERERLAGLVREREAEGLTTEPEGEQLSELAAHDQHQADVGTETFEREKDLSLLKQLAAEIDELDRALRKVDEGTYGICEACGKEIPAERLEAMPGARFCVEDQGRRRHPGGDRAWGST